MLYRYFARCCRATVAMCLTAVSFATVAASATAALSQNPQPVVKKIAPLPTRQEALIRQALYEAQDAFGRGRLASPRHDNAYDGYRRVLALDPNNEAARTGIKHISRRYLSLAKTAQAEGDYEKALGFARQAQRVAPGYEGSAHMVQYLEQQYAKQQSQDMQQIKADATQQPVTLNVKGNEYFLVTRDIAAHNVKAKMQLAEIAKKVREYDSRILIAARNDNDGRWIYSQMREALTDYRLRGNIKTDKQVRIVLLDQPAATSQSATTQSVTTQSLTTQSAATQTTP